MIQLHFSINQMKIAETMGALHSFMWTYVKYTNMEGFHRDSHILTLIYYSSETVVIEVIYFITSIYHYSVSWVLSSTH